MALVWVCVVCFVVLCCVVLCCVGVWCCAACCVVLYCGVVCSCMERCGVAWRCANVFHHGKRFAALACGVGRAGRAYKVACLLCGEFVPENYIMREVEKLKTAVWVRVCVTARVRVCEACAGV